jgi:hypothetical protein
MQKDADFELKWFKHDYKQNKRQRVKIVRRCYELERMPNLMKNLKYLDIDVKKLDLLKYI